jgi:ABC-2 type transport system permease protein
MNNILAIWKKETRIYFTTAVSYVIIGLFAAITAYFFLVLVSMYAQQSTQFMSMQAQQMLERMNFNDQVITPLFANVQVFFIFMLPAVTMRLIAEEKGSKTMQLLMTTPVRPIEIVIGKYLGAATVVGAMLLTTLVFPVILHIYGTGDAGVSPIDWASVATGYLGMFLMGAAGIAIGLCASSITESQVVAILVAFFSLLLFWVIGWAGIGKEGFWADFFNYVSLSTHMEGFARGMIRSHDIIYYFSVITLGLFLTHRFVEAERWN